ncbi:MAG: hypothetical protein JRJ03_08075 [Deltaproteobacteria bacterium]|nr:hypothetical protein [Deltaproteobacteria bacterium]
MQRKSLFLFTTLAIFLALGIRSSRPDGSARPSIIIRWASSVASAAQDLDGPQISAQASTLRSKKRDPALVLSLAYYLQKLREEKNAILVDVRRREDFEKYRIPGSINIPLFALKTKTYLKSKHLVLVNEGYSWSQLEQECAHLRKSGFKVWLLDGGLYYWKQMKGPLHGDPFAQEDLNRMPPRILFRQKDYDNLLMIDVSPSGISKAGTLFPRSISIPFHSEDKFIADFRKAMAEQGRKQFPCILLLNKKGEHYQRIESAVQRAGFKTVFFLRGGIDAYEKYLEQQAMIRHPERGSSRTIKKRTGCQ